MWAALAASVGGLGVSAYLTAAHFSSPTILACSVRGVVNCERVTSSPQSEILGVPVAVLGLAWFAGMIGLTLPPAWRGNGLLARARLSAVVAGMAFVLYLIYAELFQIRAICLWCTAAHVLAFVLFVLVLHDVSRERE